MAATVTAVALRRKFINFQAARGTYNIIHRETSSLLGGRGATDGQPPAASQSAPSDAHRPRPQRRSASQKAGDKGSRKGEPRHPWDFKLSPMVSQLIASCSLFSFMMYFFLLREESDIDSSIYRPVWERVPDITPDMAERMLETDRQFGVFYDDKEWRRSLDAYKEKYYREHPEEKPAYRPT